MRTARVGAKLFVADGEEVDLPSFIGIFHGWIQRTAVDGLLIDVADYQHVPDGPGVMLIGHEADRALDLAGGRPGMLYQHKRQEPPPELGDGLRRAVREAALGARELGDEPLLDGGLRFRADELWVRVTDGLAGQHDDASFAELEAALDDLLEDLGVADGAQIVRDDVPGGPLAATVRLPADLGLDALIDRLADAPPVAAESAAGGAS